MQSKIFKNSDLIKLESEMNTWLASNADLMKIMFITQSSVNPSAPSADRLMPGSTVYTVISIFWQPVAL